jgi:penicillin-binding protein 1A
MKGIHASYEKKDFYKPSTIVTKDVCKYSGQLATELCKKDPRGNAVIKEYFSSSNVPKDSCTVHVEVTTCNVTGKKAHSGCPTGSTTSKVYIKRPEPYSKKQSNEPTPEDLKYDLPNLSLCTLHDPKNEPEPTPTPTPGNQTSTPGNTAEPTATSGATSAPDDDEILD